MILESQVNYGHLSEDVEIFHYSRKKNIKFYVCVYMCVGGWDKTFCSMKNKVEILKIFFKKNKTPFLFLKISGVM